MSEPGGPAVFVSYARRDDKRADGAIASFVEALRLRLTQALPGASLHVFLDQSSVDPGSKYAPLIASSAANAAAFLPFLSPAWGTRAWCRRELDLFSSQLGPSGSPGLLLPLYWEDWPDPDANAHADVRATHASVFQYSFLDLRKVRTERPGTPEWTLAVANVAGHLARFLAMQAPATAGSPRGQKESTFSANFGRAVRELTERHEPGHPIHFFVGAAVDGLSDDIRRGGPEMIEVAASHYRGFLRADKLRNALNPKARAIADLTDRTEEFWNDAADEPDPWVRQRLFLLAPATLTDLGALSRWLPVFESQHARGVDVHVGDGRLWTDLGERHHFGPDGVGAHLLLVGTDLVGGYVRRDSAVLLRLQRMENLFNRWSMLLDRLIVGSVRFREGMTASAIRSEWVRRRRIGHWGDNWHQVNARPPSFFHFYAQHVECWIPDYTDLVQSCARAVQRQLIRQLRTSPGSLSVLELGVGTGGLTREIARWADAINKPFRLTTAPVAIGRLIGLEPAQRMRSLRIFEQLRAEHESVDLTLIPGGWPQAAADQAPGSLACICGSLVLHHIVSRGRESEFKQFLDGCARLLSPDGALVFADSFHGEGPARQEETKAWRTHMEDFGLPPEEVDTFLRGNGEMQRLPDRATIDRCAEAAGFGPCELLDPENASPGPRAPFRILVLRRAA